MISIVIADDHPIIRDGLRVLLSREEDFDVVGEASDGREVLDRLQESDPDILLLDLDMPRMDGLNVLQELQQSANATKVILLTASEDRRHYVQAMELGCSGIVLKHTGLGLIAESIRKVSKGELWLDAFWWPESGTVH